MHCKSPELNYLSHLELARLPGRGRYATRERNNAAVSENSKAESRDQR